MKKPIVVFGRLPDGVYGETNENVITIDLNKEANPARTYVHELFHFHYPSWTETSVKNAERNYWRKITQAGKFRVYKELFARMYISKEEHDKKEGRK